MLQRLLMFIFYLAVTSMVHATPYQFKKSLPVLRQIAPEIGTQINDIKQDSNGLIWLTAGAQLYSFDGNELTPQAIGLNVVEVYASPVDNYLLLGTSGNGVYQYDLQTTELVAVEYGAHGESLNAYILTEDARRIYIGTVNGLYIFDKETRKGTSLAAPADVLGTQVRGVTWVNDKLAVAYTPVTIGEKKGGVYLLSPDLSWSTNLLSDDMFSVWGMYFDEHKQHLWLASSNAGIFQITAKENKLLRVFNKENGSLQSNAVLAITGVDGAVYAADFQYGLIQIQDDRVEYFKSNDFFPKDVDNPNMRELYYDPTSRVLFAGLQAGGVILLDIAEQGIEYFRKSESNFASNNIWAVAELQDRSLALGIYGHGLQLRPLNGKKTTINLDPSNEHPRRNHIKKIHQLNASEVLVGTLGAGVLKVNLNSHEIEPMFADNLAVTDLVTDEYGVLATTLSGIQKWNWQGELLFSYNNLDIIDSDKYFSVVSTLHSLALGSNGGILLLSHDGQPLRKVDGCGSVVTQMIKLDEQRIAAATASGICIFTAEGNVILTIGSRDLVSMVWDQTDDELWAFGEDIIQHRFSDNTTNIYDAGLLHFNADKEAAAIMLSEFFLVASSNGLALIDSNKLSPYQPSLKLLLRNINTPMNAIFKGFTEILPSQTLAADNNSINLEMREINFRQNKSELSFRLLTDNNKSPWNITPSRFININYLSAGEYQLQLKLSSLTTKQNITRTTQLTILSPWYLRWWAWIIYGTLTVILIATLYIHRLHSIQAEKLKLEQQVLDKTTKLQSALKAKDELFSDVSHELKTPMSLILGYSQCLSQNPSCDSDNTLHQANKIYGSAQQLATMIDQLLTKSNDNAITKIVLDMVEETKTIIHNLKAITTTAKKSIRFDLPSEPMWAELGPGCWPSIVNNLLVNAVNYGVGPEICVQLKLEAGCAVLYVCNHGELFAKQAVLVQRHLRGSSKIDGQGLGLAIVNDTLRANNGEFSIYQSEDKVVAKVILPLSKQVHSEIVTNASLMLSVLSTPANILLVEDNLELGELLQQTLSSHVKVHWVTDGQQALNFLQEHSLPELIISDVMMPHMNGFELCQHVKQDPTMKHLPFILLTAKGDLASQQQGLALAADDYINKPFNTDVLRTKLINIIARTRALSQHLKQQFIDGSTTTTENTRHLQGNDLMLRLSELIQASYQNNDVKASDLAAGMHMSERNLNRKLKSLVGSSLSELLREYRLHRAKAMITAGHSIKQVCFDCGFSSQSYFSRCYKEAFGISPSTSKIKEPVG